jgi:hypothetical protein
VQHKRSIISVIKLLLVQQAVIEVWITRRSWATRSLQGILGRVCSNCKGVQDRKEYINETKSAQVSPRL